MTGDNRRVGGAAAPMLAFDGVIKRYGHIEALSGRSIPQPTICVLSRGWRSCGWTCA